MARLYKPFLLITSGLGNSRQSWLERGERATAVAEAVRRRLKALALGTCAPPTPGTAAPALLGCFSEGV